MPLAFTPKRDWRTLAMNCPSLPYWPSTVGMRDGRSVASQSGLTRLKSWIASICAKP
jgi:hypothetical protein